MSGKYQYLFGPVPSRRLGRSLGVDLTPFKTCSVDCIFCQLGGTTHRSLVRREYVPVKAVLQELEAWLADGGTADHITLSGSGEPTLHSRFGDLLKEIRKRTTIPTVLLSNGTLFTLPAVRQAARHASVVKISLNAWDQASFERIHRPHPDLCFDSIVEGIRTFRKSFRGSLWLEVFLLRGIHIARAVDKLATIAKSIWPDEIHLNTAVRPPAEEYAKAVSRQQMEKWAAKFHPPAKVIATFAADSAADADANEESLLAMLRRRPCTAQQIADVSGLHLHEVAKHLGKLERQGRIQPQVRGKQLYYRAKVQGVQRVKTKR